MSEKMEAGVSLQDQRTVTGLVSQLGDYLDDLHGEVRQTEEALGLVLQPAPPEVAKGDAKTHPECSCELAYQLQEQTVRVLELTRTVRDLRLRVGL
jgi:hypothetical protein